MARTDDSRSLLREIFTTEADLIPNEEDGTLTVRLHHLTNHSSDKAAVFLAEYLNASETYYPGTNLRLIYKLVSDLNPPGQEFRTYFKISQSFSLNLLGWVPSQ